MFVYKHQLFCGVFLVLSLSGISTMKFVSVDFEVYGTVQGVYFRMYTKKEADALGVRGWCMNTTVGTVKGVIQGESGKIKDMKNWLEKKGSPSSKIEKAKFTNETEIEGLKFSSFEIKRK